MGNSQAQETSCFTCNGHQETNIEWRKQLKLHCNQIQSDWAILILKNLSKIPKEAIHVYLNELRCLNSQYQVQRLSRKRGDSYVTNLTNSIGLQDTSSPVKQRELDIGLERQLSCITVNQQSFCYVEKDMKDDDQQMAYYIAMSQTVKQHLRKQDHQLNTIRNFFLASFIKSYGKTRSKDDAISMQTDIESFSRIYAISIGYYYNLSELLMQVGEIGNLLSTENIIASIKAMLFDDEIIYQTVYDIYLDQSKDQIESFRVKISPEFNEPPSFEQYPVPIQYRLDEQTHQYLFQKYQNVKEQCNPMTYMKSVQYLQLLREKKSPQSKLKCLLSAQEKIFSQIKKFYDLHNAPFSSVVEEKDLIVIMRYIYAKANVFDLPIHLQIVEQFTSTQKITLFQIVLDSFNKS